MRNIVIMKNILSFDRGLIGHQVNMLGIMGGGLALQIRRKYPKVYEIYHSVCETQKPVSTDLGKVLPIVTDGNKTEDLFILNMFAQEDIGGGACQTDYEALKSCLKCASGMSVHMGLTLYLPFMIGCDLAGGDWRIVRQLIQDEAPNAVICVLPEKWDLYEQFEKRIKLEEGISK